MNKAEATKALSAYKDFYTKTVSQIAAIKASKDFTEEYKAAAIDKVMAEYNSKSEAYNTKAKEAVNTIIEGYSQRRQANIRKGLESADQINLLVNGIKNNVYTIDMLKDITATLADNPFALDTIRSTLVSSDNTDMQLFGASIPQNRDDRIIGNLNNIATKLSEVPSPMADSKADWNSGFFQNGVTFDSWANYINDNIDDDE